MLIQFYNLECEKIKYNKTSHLKLVDTLNGTLKSGTSIIKPVILIEDKNDKIKYSNYCYINEFKRYYFITDINIQTNNLIQVFLSVDVLMTTFANDYSKGINGIVARNEMEFDISLEDEILFTKYKKEVTEEVITSPFDIDTSSLNPIIYSNRIINENGILEVATGYTTYGYKIPIEAKQVKAKLIPAQNLRAYSFGIGYIGSGGTVIIDKGSLWKYESDSELIPVTIKETPSFTKPQKRDYAFICVKTSDYHELLLSSFTRFNTKKWFTDLETDSALNIIISYTNDQEYSGGDVVNDSDVLNKVISNDFTNSASYVHPMVFSAYQYHSLFSVLLNQTSSKISSINSITVYPCEIEVERDPDEEISNVINVRLANADIPNCYCYKPKSFSTKAITIAEFTIDDSEDFKDYEPFTEYEVYLPYANWIKLSANQVLGKKLKVQYIIDGTSSTSFVFVTDETNKKLIYGNTCNLGVSVPVTSSNIEQNNANRNANTLNMMMNVLSGVVSMASGGPLAKVGGALTVGKSIGNYITNQSKIFDTASSTISSGQIGLYSSQDVRLRKTKIIPIIESTASFLHTYGKPLNQFRELEDMLNKGFIKFGELHFNINNSILTLQELNELDSLFKSGVIV